MEGSSKTFNSSLVVGTTAATLLVVCCFHLWKSQPSKEQVDGRPIKSNAGILETIRELSGGNAPFFFVDCVKSLDSTAFQLNIPFPAGVYVLASARDQREMLMEKGCDRPITLIAALDQIGGCKTTLTLPMTHPRYKHLRKGALPAFSAKEVRRMNIICKKHAAKWIQDELEPPLLKGESPIFDPTAAMHKITFRTILEAGFEYQATDDEFHIFETSLETATQEFTFRQIINPLRKVVGRLLPDVRKAHAASKKLQELALTILLSYRNKSEADRSTNNTLIKMIETNEHLTDKEKMGEIFLYLMAGFETTGNTLTNTIVLLAQHPEDMKAVNESFRKVRPDADGILKPTEYLQWVGIESRRVLPVVAIAPIRILNRDHKVQEMKPSTGLPNKDTVFSTKTLPKGAIAFLPIMLAHRDATVFDEPDQFRPRRWENATQEMTSSILSFAVGQRSCIGRSLATSELDCVLPVLLSKYTFEVEEAGVLKNIGTLKHIGTKLRVSRV